MLINTNMSNFVAIRKQESGKYITMNLFADGDINASEVFDTYAEAERRQAQLLGEQEKQSNE